MLKSLRVGRTLVAMKYEWDPAKASENRRKHGVDFVDAIHELEDPNRLEEVDDRRDYGEEAARIESVFLSKTWGVEASAGTPSFCNRRVPTPKTRLSTWPRRNAEVATAPGGFARESLVMGESILEVTEES